MLREPFGQHRVRRAPVPGDLGVAATGGDIQRLEPRRRAPGSKRLGRQVLCVVVG
ncbi:hypothetical protein [Flexivirga alba]|uniref:Uncharacterized protein n=1 Tax=Flexivirga alba TaxID=702742 RepID=A0ABW2AD48_9MICO